MKNLMIDNLGGFLGLDSQTQTTLRSDAVLPCQYWINNERWYNLKPLQRPEGDYYDEPGRGDSGTEATERFLFDFCEAFSPTPKYVSCEHDDRFGYLVNLSDKDPEVCTELTGSNASNITFTELFDAGNEKKPIGVQLDFPESEQKCESGSNYGLRIKLTCNNDLTAGEASDVAFSREIPGTCIQEIKMSAKEACPSFDASVLFDFLSKYTYLWGVLFIAKGMVSTFYGRKAIKTTVFLISFLLGTFSLMMLIYSLFVS